MMIEKKLDTKCKIVFQNFKLCLDLESKNECYQKSYRKGLTWDSNNNKQLGQPESMNQNMLAS